jgi:CDP-diacylglycerol---glycerol-3-phosphate 3-phosphatidyltransferase
MLRFVRRLVTKSSAWLPKGWADLGRQIALVIVVDLAYETVRGIADGQRSVAFAHGQQIIDIERATSTLFEPSMQGFFLQANWLIDIANQIYMNSQFAVVLGFFFWVYFFRNESFYFVRNMFMVSMGLALIGYTLYPTAPPRLFTEYGFVDTINDYSNVNHDSALAKLFINPYAAVPSMHCAFSMMLGVSGALLCRNRFFKAFWCVWPLLIAWVVVVTGNHYWIDIVLGWMVAGTSALVAHRLLARARPDAWSWRVRSPQEAEASLPPGGPTPAGSTSLTPVEPSAPPRAPSGRRNGRQARNGQELRAYARDRLIESRLTPNAISMVGLAGNLLAAVLITQRLFFLAGIAFILGSVMDTLDGRYSRMSGKGTLFGAFLDSTLDRIEEGIVLAAVAGYFAATGDDFAAAMCVIAVLGSLMVSYTRARAEALGVECKVGLATRPVRVVVLSIGLVFAKGAGIGDFELLAPAIYVIAALTTFTAFQRVWHVRNELSSENPAPPDL